MLFLKYVSIAAVVLVVWMLSIPAHSCEVTFKPPKLKGKLGQTVKVTAVVWWEHRRCQLGKDEVDMEVRGGKLVKQSGWGKVDRGVYENDLQIKLERKGTVELDVHRRCRKKGLSIGILKIKVE